MGNGLIELEVVWKRLTGFKGMRKGLQSLTLHGRHLQSLRGFRRGDYSLKGYGGAAGQKEDYNKR